MDDARESWKERLNRFCQHLAGRLKTVRQIERLLQRDLPGSGTLVFGVAQRHPCQVGKRLDRDHSVIERTQKWNTRTLRRFSVRPIVCTLTIGIFVVVKLSFFIKIQRNLALIRGEIKKWEAGFSTGNARIDPTFSAKKSRRFGTRLSPVFFKPCLVFPFEFRRIEGRLQIRIASTTGT